MITETAANFFSTICDLQAMDEAGLNAFCDDACGELFVEYSESEVLKIENDVVQSPEFSSSRGFGLRTFVGDETRYSYSSSLNPDAVKSARDVLGSFSAGSLYFDLDKVRVVESKHNLYDDRRFMNSISLEDKINFLIKINDYARSKCENITQVSAVLAASWSVISVTKDYGKKTFDIRPLVRLSVSVIVAKNGIMESGICTGGGRYSYEYLINDDICKTYVDEAIRQASVKLEAIKAPAGEMPVVLGNGWTGILLHEAVGHGLEGDAIRKKTSSFHNLLGEMVAAPDVTVVDDGAIAQQRGSINVDDEGNCSQRNVLIENGRLVGFMQDRMNARLMDVPTTGNGRRENYKSTPLPRMTNTFMIAGDKTFDEMIGSVKKGLFAKSFSDGQVDISSGKFVFSASEAYLIENGKITAPVKGAMLIGDGPSILKKISMIGNDFSMDMGTGTCGKAGQWVPAGVGQPSLLIDEITVGGSDL